MEEGVIQMFVDEARERLANIEAELPEIANGSGIQDPELLNTIFRTAHFIKSGACFLGLRAIRTLAHRVENVLGLLRSRDMEPSTTVINTVLIAFGVLDEMLDDVEASDAADIEPLIEALLGLISACLPGERLPALVETREVLLPDGRPIFRVCEHDLIQARRAGNFLYVVEYDLIHDVMQKGKTPLDLLRFLEKSGMLLDCRTDPSGVGDLDQDISRRVPLYILYATILEEDLVRAVFQVNSRYIHTVRLEEPGIALTVPLAQHEVSMTSLGVTIDEGELDDMEAAFDKSLAQAEELAHAATEEALDTEPDEAENFNCITLSGRLTIERAPEFKDLFLKALDAGVDFDVDMTAVESVDVTFLQVLWAAYKSAEKRGLCISVAGSIPDELKETAALAGFADLSGETQCPVGFPLLGERIKGE
ncbi:STAS domain-containing protein [Oceanidesulfovibrio marinus]|uniref:STAS domain-containing protein n=1 Tax=Oceanidesulfovibrio marinus TaxID=370038 RepID=A0A6P1ZLS5_9BACT|nr:Hpt domain-containing protein [Oceanidesulfovibrio marinus]TVM36756.1 hypothetical protein DQK91_02215 [Oceanidesulfovibrio marinus]